MKTYTARPSTIKRQWYVVDAANKTLGRLATQIATRLRGKHKPEYTPHMDTGDYIVVINAAQIKVTGAKTQDKMYYRHTEYPGGLKTTNFAKLVDKKPEEIIQLAVKGMLPRGSLGRDMLRKLKIYRDAEHEHAAQQPTVLELGTE